MLHFMPRSRFSALALLALIAPTTALAETCALPAHSGGDQAPVVKAEPWPSSATLGALPHGDADTDEATTGSTFIVTELQDGWARVEGVTGPEGRPVPQSGWIDIAAVHFVAQTELGFAKPDPSSTLVWSGADWPIVSGGQEGDIRLLGCSGEWALLSFPAAAGENPNEVSAWVRGLCNNQWTSCDGITGDHAADYGVSLD